MNNQFLLTLLSNLIPLLAIGFVGVLLLYKIYIKIRSKFNTTVNCWFCNQNARVPYLQSNSWTCPSCEQYNGFTKDGDYNREIFEQLDCSNLSGGHLPIGTTEYSDNSSEYARRIATLPAPRNGFCDGCNEAQRLKVEKLAQFEPKNESRFEEELKVYKAQLEEQYRLCSTCDRHLNKVLREKKKMVLGSKFLDFIIKGAETLKQPHFNQIRFARKNHWKQRCSLWISILTALNIACLLSGLPALRRETFTSVVGDALGSQLFLLCSHVLALSKVLASYFEGVWTHPTAVKLGLFIRTIFMMLLYSMGLRWPPSVGARLSSVYLLACPFVLLSLAFVYNVVDGFKLTRYTFLLAVWSIFAGGLVGEKLILSAQVIELLASLATLLLTVTSKNKLATTQLQDDDSNGSFHKIYSEDYLSDEDTLSILSQHLNSSAASMRSLGSNSSYRRRRLSNSPTQQRIGASNARLARSPLTSSAFSLNNFPSSGHAQISPNSSFQHNFNVDDNCHNQSVRSEYAASMCNFPTVAGGGGGGGASLPRSSLFASNLELSSRCKTPLMPFGFNGSTCGTSNGNINHTVNFLQPLAYSPYQAQRKSDESFFTTLNGGGAGGGGGGIQQQQQTNNDMFSGRIAAQRPLASPFSISNNSVYEPAQRASNLLTPSRFSTTCLASNASASSWLSGGYFNQRQPANQSNALDAKRMQNLYGHRNGMTVIDENLSRASSQSSGFESQNERPVNHSSRENSFCPDAPELLQRTMTAAADTARGFQPIEPNNGILFSPRPSLLSASQTNLARPLSINCSSSTAATGIDAAGYAASNLWLGSSSVRGRNGLVGGGGGALDSFNLRKINEDLPTIRRGDLLRKWKEGQALS